MPQPSPATIRIRVILALAVVVPLGFAAKFYSGPGRWWVNNWGPASVPYVLFFMLLVFLLVPRKRAIIPIAVGVCTVTCLLELLQMWQPPWLQAIRTTFLGKALLGNAFSWWDMPAYFIAAALGWWLLHWLVGRAEEP